MRPGVYTPVLPSELGFHKQRKMCQDAFRQRPRMMLFVDLMCPVELCEAMTGAFP